MVCLPLPPVDDFCFLVCGWSFTTESPSEVFRLDVPPAISSAPPTGLELIALIVE